MYNCIHIILHFHPLSLPNTKLLKVNNLFRECNDFDTHVIYKNLFKFADPFFVSYQEIVNEKKNKQHGC